MTVLLDTNVIVRHLTQEPPAQGQAATRLLASAESLFLADVIVAETVHVLQSVYKTPRKTVAVAISALTSMRSVVVEHGQVVRRSIDLYEREGMDFTDAYLVAFAEVNRISQVASFDQGMDKAIRKASTVTRLDPAMC